MGYESLQEKVRKWLVTVEFVWNVLLFERLVTFLDMLEVVFIGNAGDMTISCPSNIFLALI